MSLAAKPAPEMVNLPLRGDVNGDGVVNVSDIIYLVNFFMANGAPPVSPCNADVTDDSNVAINDTFYLINYILNDGPVPAGAPCAFPPVASDDSYTVPEGATLNVSPGNGVLANDTDPAGGVMTAAVVTQPSHGTLTLNADGSFAYVHDGSESTSDSFTYRATAGTQTSPVATVTILVTPANDAPTARADAYAVANSGTLTVPASGVLANDFDPEGATLSAIVSVNPANGTLALNSDGSFAYVHNGTGTTDSFTYRAMDGSLTSAPATVTITIGAVVPPVAANDDYTVAEGGMLSIAAPGVMANDTDPQALPLTPSLVAPPAHGALTFNADGSFSYAHDGSETATDSFLYQVGDGVANSGIATVTIAVTPVNDSPVALSDSYVVAPNGTITIPAPGVAINDSDPEGSPLTVALSSAPTHGIVTLNADGSFTYKHNGADPLIDVFTYRVSDGSLDSLPANVFITVSPNTPPVANGDTYSVNEGATLSVASGAGVLSNDSDPEGSNLQAILVAAPAHGTLTLQPDGAFTYVHDGSETTTDSFTYRAADEVNTSAAATVIINVAPVNDPPVAAADSYSVGRGGTLNVAIPGVLANDSDSDSVNLFAVAASAPAHGTLALSDDGSFTYIHDGSDTTSDSFTYSTFDGGALSAPATVSISVGANQPPVANPDSYTVAEGGTLNVPATGVLANDTDAENDAIAAAVAAPPAHGTLALNADGSFTYTHDGSETTTDSFTYQANDGFTNSSVTTVAITVTPVNDTPVAAGDAYTVAEGGTLTIAAPGVLANDTDADSATLTAVLGTGVSHGTLTLNSDGSFTYTHDGSETTSDSFTYTANDGTLGSSAVTVAITVTPVNDAPTATDDAFATTEDTPLVIAAAGVLANDTDPDSGALTSIAVTNPANGTLALNADGGFTYTPAANFSGSDSFTYKANDGSLDSAPATVTITVSPLNDAPVPVDDAYAVNEDTPLNVTAPGVLANDADVDGPGPLTAQLVTGPANGTLNLNADGSFTYAPSANFNGSDSFTYRAGDGVTSSVTNGTVQITVGAVNDAPVATPQSVSTNEDTPVAITLAGTDFEGDPLAFAIATNPAHGTISGVFPNITYTPGANFNGTDSLQFVANDGAADSLATTILVTIAPVNDAPVAAADSYATGAGGSVTPAPANGVLSNDFDIEGDALTATLITPPATGTLSFNADGSFTYTPPPIFTGTVTFTYQASDGVSLSNTATVTVTVRATNTAPVANAQSVTTAEDTAAAITLTGTDADGDPLSYVLATTPSHGTLTGAGANFTYTPNANYNGPDSFDFAVLDGFTSSQATVTISVTPVNDAPVAVDDVYGTTPDTPVSMTAPQGVLANDTDVDINPLQAIVVTNPANGTIVLAADGGFDYFPNSGFTGMDSFTYKANDGTADSNVATVTFNVTANNNAPVADAQSVTTAEDTPLAVTLSGSDSDGDALTWSVTVAPAHGSLSGALPNVLYTPAPDYNGLDSFQFVVNDGFVNSASATVSITITAVNDAPLAPNASLATPEDTALPITLGASDVDGDALAYTVLSGPANGALTGTAPNLTYTPNANFNGTDSFTYKVSDGTVDSPTATVTISVYSVNDVPVVAPVTTSTNEDSADVFSLSGTDADGDPLTFNIVSGPAHGTLNVVVTVKAPTPSSVRSPLLPQLTTVTYTPDPNYTGADSFTYDATDGVSTSLPATVTINVTGINDPPVATTDNYTTAEDTALVIAAPGVLANDTDVDSATLTAIVVTNPPNGSLALNADGSFTYTPNANYNGPDGFTYKANDGFADSATATVNINVTAVNDAPVATSDAYSTNEETALNVPAPGVLANDGDVDGPSLGAVPVANPANGTLLLSADGSFTYTPNADFSGTDTFSYRANDTLLDSANATVTITVNGANDAPVNIVPAAPPVAGEDVGLIFSIALGDEIQVTDVDAGAATIEVMLTVVNGTVSLSQTTGLTVTAGANGTASVTFQGTIADINAALDNMIFTGNSNYSGPASITIATNDLGNSGAGGALSDTDTVNLTVIPINDPPLVTAGATLSYTEGDPATAIDSTITVSDPDDATLVSATAQITAGYLTGEDVLGFVNTPNISGSFDAPTGTLTLTGNDTVANYEAALRAVTYQNTSGNPSAAPRTVTWQAHDSTAGGQTATSTINVAAVNDAPVANGDAYTVAEGGVLTIAAAAGVLANDSDAEGSTLTAFLVSGPANGTFTLNGDGSFTYTHDGSETTADSFTYKANDGALDSATVTVNLTVTPVNDPPVFTSIAVASLPENTTAVTTVVATDAEAAPVTFSITGGADAALFSIVAATGALSFSAAPNFEAPADADANNVYLVDVTASDGTSPSVQSLTITVTDANEAPVFTSTATPSVAENQTAVVTATVGDPEGGAITFSITGGADAALFSINATTGALTFNAAPNFETPADADANNVYLVDVTATDGTNPVTQNLSVTVTDANEAPAFTSANTASVAENTTAVTTVTTTDAEGNTVTYSITGGADAALFSINATTGALSFNAAPDFELPADGDSNNAYLVDVTANDGTNDSVQSLTITVTNIDEQPVFTSSATPSVPENTTAVVTVVATDPEGASVTFSITGGADAALFSINATTGALTFNTAPDFEAPADADTNNVYLVDVTATDGVLTSVQSLSVTVTANNEAPSITSGAAVSVAENNTAVTTVTTTDPEGDTITYSITSGADAALFSINSTTGVLTFNAAPDFEAPTDSDTNNQYVVEVTATDGTTPVAQTITVTVTDVNEAPSFTSSTTPSVPENTTAVTTVTTTDPEGNTVTYSITGGADAALFSIDASTGVLTFNAARDFESPADADTNNQYIVEVTATDGTTPVAQTITVTLTDVNEAPSFTSGTTASVAENTTAVTTVTTTDPEGNTITYSITGGADAADFSINSSTGALAFNAAPDFEAPADADTNNQYAVQVTATDGTNPIDQTITVTVTDVDEQPVFTSTATPSIPENTTAVVTVQATDPEGATPTYSITGGADQALFTINGATGALSFLAAPDFETPGDADTNNVYVVQVTASDSNPAVQTISVTVTDANDPPVFTSSATPSVQENTTAVVTVQANDPEAGTVTYSITAGADAALFSINPTTGALTFIAAPNFESPADADANNVYELQVTATDGFNPVQQNISVTVTNANEAPSITSSNSASVAEGSVAVLTVTTTDPEGNTITYSITGGADSGDFTVDLNTGALTFAAIPDFEAPADADANNVYVVEVTATDGTNNVPQTITVTVTDVDEAPVFTSSATPSVPENTTAVVTVTANDPEGATPAYSITGGADQALFSIDGATGALAFLSAPNFESPADADTNNTYLVQVTATDGTNPAVQSLTVTVTDVNEAPSFSSSATPSVPENTTAVVDVDATDPDGTAPTYSITGGADAALFSIVGATGVLTFNAAPNFEAPADADANNVYLVEVTATDGTNPVIQAITVTVTNVNEAPVITSSNTASVPENTTAVVDVDATDPEGTAPTYSITGGADAADFSIVPATGVLTFVSAPNFESPADADTNNTYLVQVTATDGTNPVNQTITVTVTNVNEAPVNSVPGAQTFNEDVNRVFSSGNANLISISDPDGDVNVQVTLTATNGTLSTNGIAGLTFTTGDGTDDATLVFTGTITNINLRLNGLTYKPTPNYYGSASIAITTDDQGNTGSGGALQDGPDSIALTISPVNDKPTCPSYTVANGSAFVTHSGIGITIGAADSNELKEDATDVDDHDPYSELTVQIVGGTLSPANATLTLIDAGTGAFYFEPPGGLSGSAAASFQYQVCDNGDAGLGLAAQCSDPATVQFTITGSDTWFVDDTDAAGCGVGCNGSRTKPLVGLNNATLVGRGTGDKIFAFSGTYNHGLTMNASETLVGQASTGAFDTVLGVSVPSNGTLDTRPTLSGAAVTLQNTVNGAASITMRGITIASTSNGFVASGAATMTVLESSVSAAGKAVDLLNSGASASGITFTSTSSSAGTHGISLQNVTGTIALGSGSLSGNTTAAFFLKDANNSTITYGGSMAPSGTGRAVLIGTADGNSGVNSSNGLEAGSSVTLSGTINSGGVGVYESSGGTLNLTSATHTWSTGTTRGVELIDNNGATINFSGGNLAITTSSGTGFHASQGGTVNVTGSNNTISTTAGIGFESVGTPGEHLGGGYAFKTISSTNGTKGISVQYFDGAFSVSGDGADGGTLPDSATAGGTITGSDQRGAEFIDVDGPVSLGGMTFTNPADTAGPDASVAAGTCGNIPSGGSNTGCYAGIHLDTVSNVTLHTINVSGSGQIGINGNAISNLIVNTVNVSNSGNTAGEDGIRLYNVSGTGGSVNALAVTNSFGKGLLIENTNVALATSGSPFTFTNSNFQNSSNAQGATLSTATTGTMYVKFISGTISGNFSNGIQTAGLGTGTLGINVDGTSFSNNTSAVVIQSSGGTTSFDVRNITHVGRTTNASCGICLKSDGSGVASGSVINNVIGNGTPGSGASCGGGCNGINVDARNTSQMTVDIRGNTIRNVDQNGIGIRGGEGSSKLNVTLTGNLIKDPDNTPGTLAAIFADSGVLSSDTNCVTVTIGGTTAYPGSPSSAVAPIQNRIEGNWLVSGVRVRKLFSAPVFNLPGYDGSGVVAWITARNSFSGVTTAVTQNAGSGGAFTGGASCP